MQKKTLTISLGTALLMTGLASADTLRGDVYQVTDADVYITMPDTTVARVPVETANFYEVDGDRVSWQSLRTGQAVVVDYTPVYGFQKFYHSSSVVETTVSETPAIATPVIETYLVDIDPKVTEYIEYNGKLYRVVKP